MVGVGFRKLGVGFGRVGVGFREVKQERAAGCQRELGSQIGGTGFGDQREVGGQTAEPGVVGLLAHVVAGVEAGDGLRERAVARRVGGDPGEQVDERPESVGFGVEQHLGLGGGQHAGAGRVAFAVVAVEQVRRPGAARGGGELPAEVERVVEGDVDADRPGRRMDVGGVAGQHDPAADVLGRLPGGVAEPGQPARGPEPDVAAERLVHGRLEPVEGDRVVLVGRGLPVGGDDPEVTGAGNGEHAPPGAVADAERQRSRLVQFDVAEQREPGRGGAGEVDAGLPADGAAAAVAADQVRGGRPVVATGAGLFDGGGDGLGVLLEGAQFVAAPDVGAEVAGAGLEDLLHPGLRDAQRIRVIGARAVQAERRRQAGERGLRQLPALVDERVGEAASRQQVEGAGVEVESAAEVRALGAAFDDDGGDRGQSQFAREQQPGRAGR